MFKKVNEPEIFFLLYHQNKTVKINLFNVIKLSFNTIKLKKFIKCMLAYVSTNFQRQPQYTSKKDILACLKIGIV